MERETAVTRCRDMIIERSKWVCSIAVMSALGVAMFGVAGASGRGSAWSAVHPAKAHMIVVHPHGSAHISSGGASHALTARRSRAPPSPTTWSRVATAPAPRCVHATATASYASSAHPVTPAASAPPATSHSSRAGSHQPRVARVPCQSRRRFALAVSFSRGPPLGRFGRTATSPPRPTPPPPTAPPSAPSSAPGPARASRCRAPTRRQRRLPGRDRPDRHRDHSGERSGAGHSDLRRRPGTGTGTGTATGTGDTGTTGTAR